MGGVLALCSCVYGGGMTADSDGVLVVMEEFTIISTYELQTAAVSGMSHHHIVCVCVFPFNGSSQASTTTEGQHHRLQPYI